MPRCGLFVELPVENPAINKKGMRNTHPLLVYDTPAAIRTRDLQLRRLTLYPAELRVPDVANISQQVNIVWPTAWWRRGAMLKRPVYER